MTLWLDTSIFRFRVNKNEWASGPYAGTVFEAWIRTESKCSISNIQKQEESFYCVILFLNLVPNLSHCVLGKCETFSNFLEFIFRMIWYTWNKSIARMRGQWCLTVQCPIFCSSFETCLCVSFCVCVLVWVYLSNLNCLIYNYVDHLNLNYLNHKFSWIENEKRISNAIYFLDMCLTIFVVFLWQIYVGGDDTSKIFDTSTNKGN